MIEKHRGYDTITATSRERSANTRESLQPKSHITKVINTATAKSPEKTPVDLDKLRRREFSNLQNEIKKGAQTEAAKVPKGLNAFSMASRFDEVLVARAKNNLSSISTLPGSSSVNTRMSMTMKRDASARDLE